MNDTSKILSIIAFYLSEFDELAVKTLGYSNRSETFKDISLKMNRDNNYLKLRRDEFDALPDSKSSRKGWRHRPAVPDVIELATYLKGFSFDELTQIVISLINNQGSKPEPIILTEADSTNEILTEIDIENIINFTDDNSQLKIRTGKTIARIYNKTIVTQLKILYKGKCQICGSSPLSEFHTDICEAHHIDYFAYSQNNNSNNIIILCPNHHRMIHKLNPVFNRKDTSFIYSNGLIERLTLNKHLT